MRIGILTGGGDCPGLNAAIRAVAKGLLLEHDIRPIGIHDGFRGLVERNVKELDYRAVSGILTQGGTILGTDNRTDPFALADRGGADASGEVMDYCRELDMQGLVVIGGDGTLTIAHRFQELGLGIVGVPKTIDNDLEGTDRTIGFDTAVAIAAEAIDRVHTTAQSHHRVFLVETMGRYSGWIALHAGVAGGADVILIPEIEYEIEEIVRVCQARQSGGQRFTIVVVAEGARPKGGEMVVQRRIEDSPDPIRLGGIAAFLTRQLESALEIEVRCILLGHLQRGGTPTANDRIMASAMGARAARMAGRGEFGSMVAYRNGSIETVPLARVAGRNRLVPPDSDVVAAARAVGTSFGLARP